MKILLLADLQIEGGQSLGHGEYGEGSRFADQEKMLGQIADIAEREQVGLAILAGDTFDRSKPSPWAILAIQEFLSRLPGTLILSGNHDVKSLALPSVLECLAPVPDGDATIVDRPSQFDFGGRSYTGPQMTDVTGRGEQRTPDVRVHCLPWMPNGFFADSPSDRDEANAWIATRLALTAQQFKHLPGARNILVGHWAIHEAQTATGLSAEVFREPLIPLQALVAPGFDMVAFGHIHAVQALSTEPPVLYLGSPWVGNFGEVGHPHGVWIYDTDVPEMRFVPINDRPFYKFDGLEALDDFHRGQRNLGAVRTDGDMDGAVVRIRYSGTELADHDAITKRLRELGASKIFIQPQIEKHSRARLEDSSRVDALDAQSAFDLFLRTDGTDPDRSARARELHSGFLRELA